MNIEVRSHGNQKKMMNLTDRFIRQIQSLSQCELQESTGRYAKGCLLDYLGATLAGSRMTREKTAILMTALAGSGSGVSVIGLDRKAPVAVAALVNGISSHAAELDDGVISGIVHPGAPVLSALLPVAEEQSIDGRRLLLGIVSGYEATVRLANAIQPSHKMRGYHATATCGGIGAALGILNMTDATEETMKNAVSAAAVSAGGSLKVLEDGSQLKPFNPGHAALTAVVSVALAKAGFKGPDDVMSGRAGFLAMMADAYKEEALFPERDQKLCIEDVYVKPYAACRYCHPAIEAALQIRGEEGICVDDIEWIRVATYRLAVDHHDHTVV